MGHRGSNPRASALTAATHNQGGTALLRCRARVAPGWETQAGVPHRSGSGGTVFPPVMAAVVQSVEHPVVIQDVAGSSPVRRPT